MNGNSSTKKFVKATAQRMARSAAAAMLSVMVVGNGFLNAFDIEWDNVIGVGAGAAFVSLLLAVVGNATSGDGPAFGPVEVTPPVDVPPVAPR